MSDIAIRCEGLSKQYRIGQQERYKALRDVLTDAAAAPFRRFRTALERGPQAADGRPRAEEGNGAGRPSAVSGQPAANGHPSAVAGHPETIWALDQVSFDVQRGEVVGIIGRNGAGKSTLLKILSRITKPTKGHAEIRGRVGSLLEVGTGFHPELTGRENIYLNGAILGMRKTEIDRKFDEIVAFAEVEKFIDTPVKRYSSGMYVRLAFAIAAHMETEVLLVDEVLAVGDAQFQKKCLGKMDDVAKQGRTVIFVSHDMNAMQVLCQKVIHLEHGKAVGIGKPTEQITKYLSGRNSRSRITNEDEIVLRDKLIVRWFEFTPNPVVHGNPVKFVLELSATETIRLDEVAVLIYTSLGRRLAILDLRRRDQTYRLSGNGIETISGTIQSFPFVEGEYHIGLYLNWGEVVADFCDLIDLEIVGDTSSEGMVPYEAAARGIVELKFKLDPRGSAQAAVN